MYIILLFFFFKQKTAYEVRISDWSSDVCSSDLKDYADSPFNRATQARRQPGSTFKLFVYLAALRAGWKPDDMIDNRPIEAGSRSEERRGGKEGVSRGRSRW